MKKLIWTALVAVTSATAATFAVRGLSYAWRRIAHESPPAQPKWARWLVGGPLSKGAEKAVG